MQQRTSRVLRIVFLVVGALFALLGIVTITLFLVLRPPGDHGDALRGGFVYLVIAGVSFFAACSPVKTLFEIETENLLHSENC